MIARTITEKDIWDDAAMYPDLSVTTETPNPTPVLVTITMSGEYANRLLRTLNAWKAQGGNRGGNQDTSVLRALLEKALTA